MSANQQAGGSSSSSICLPFSRGVLRPWCLQDAPDVAKHANNRNVWVNCSDRFPHPYTEQDAVNWINMCMGGTNSSSSSGPEQQPVSQLAIHHSSAGVIGGIGVFHRQDVQRFTKELGYWLGEGFWGQGIGSEVVGVFVSYVWAAFPEAVRIEALVYDYNERSARILQKHGFKLEGRLVKAAFKDGKFADSLVFGLVRPAGV